MRTIYIGCALVVGATLACTADVTDADLVLHSSSLSAAKYSDWSTPVNLGPIVNSTSNEQNAQLL